MINTTFFIKRAFIFYIFISPNDKGLFAFEIF